MSNIAIGVDQIEETIENILDTYNDETLTSIKKSAKTHMDKLVAETKKTAPVKSGHLKKNITSKKVSDTKFGCEYIWYVKAPYYRETHLVENGHMTKNGGRTKATHFVKNASEPIIDDYVKDVEEAIKGD